MVKELSPSDFIGNNLIDKTPTFIMFYAPWCGHCQHLKPVWEQLGKTVGFCSIAKIDADKYKINGINGFPTLKMYKGGKEVDTYNGGRSLQELLDYCMTMCKKETFVNVNDTNNRCRSGCGVRRGGCRR